MAHNLSRIEPENKVYLTEPVRKKFDKLSKIVTKQDHARLTREIGMLKTFGTTLGEPHASFVEDKLWELSARVGKKWIRILYYEAGRGEFVLVHAVEKKTNRLPRREIELALKRMRELENQFKNRTEP